MRCKVVLRKDLDAELIKFIESRPEKPIRALAIFDLLRRGMAMPFSLSDPNLLHIESSNPKAYILTFSCHEGSDIANRWLAAPMRARSTYFRSLMKNGHDGGSATATASPGLAVKLPQQPTHLRTPRNPAPEKPGALADSARNVQLTPPDPTPRPAITSPAPADTSPTELDQPDHDAPVVLRSLR